MKRIWLGTDQDGDLYVPNQLENTDCYGLYLKENIDDDDIVRCFESIYADQFGVD